MTRRTAPLAVVLAGLLAGFLHAAVTVPAPGEVRPIVRCFEDGSCSNGHCEPLQLCDDSRD